ncbi:MAG: hypothetical protein IPN76_32060 [Saprospiraceae bacterium]|nr:hypothetical protein [Saprospiraceae bacterium]
MKKINIPFGHFLLCLLALFPLNQATGQGFELLFNTGNNAAILQGGLGYDIIETNDNNFLVLTNELGFDSQILKKLDPNGNLIWQQEVYSDSSFTAVSILETALGNIVLAGHLAGFFVQGNWSKSFYWQLRAADGSLIEENFYFDDVSDFTCTGAVLSPDGQIILSGFKNYNSPSPRMALVNMTVNGTVNWVSDWPCRAEITNGNVCFLDNNVGVAGYFDPASGNVALQRFDLSGNLLAQQILSQTANAITDLEPAGGAGLFVGLSRSGDCIFKLNNDLQMEWSMAPLGTFGQLLSAELAATPDGGCGATGYTGGQYVQLYKINAAGVQEWATIWEDNDFISGGEGSAITTTANNGFAFTGIGFASKNFVIGTDGNGVVNTHTITGRIVVDFNGNCQLDAEDFPYPMNLTLSGAPGIYNDQTSNNGLFNFTVETGTYDLVIDAGLGFQVCQPISVDASQPFGTTNLGDVLVSPDVIYTISGTVFQNSDPTGGCILNLGELPLPGIPLQVNISPNANFQALTDATGQYSFSMPNGIFFTVSTDSTGVCNSCNNFVGTATQNLVHDIGIICLGALEGRVFNDENANCQFDTGEQGLIGWQVAVVRQNTTDTIFINTNNIGGYEQNLNIGTYEVFVLPPNNLWASCAGPFLLNVTNGPNATYAEFPMQAQAVCPRLWVDIGTNLIRPCVQSTYTVKYCNEGTDAAIGAYVEVALDPLLFLTASQFPATDIGNNTYRFDIGDVQLGACGEFWFKANLACWATPGATHCVEAHIFPDSICAPTNPIWDGSNIELQAVCNNGEVKFTIANTGLGNMAAPITYLVIEDNVLLRPDEEMLFQLAAGADTTVVFPAAGNTLRLETQQAPGHPTSTLTAAWVEGCGATGSEPIEISYVTQYPFGDEEDFLAVDCRQNVFSYDPNDKLAFPQGIGNQRFIQNTTELDYQIRFQNTGTASAFEVVLRDTLSPFLDPETLRPGASSHPYNFAVENGNVAVFTFPNINLPPQSAGEEASQGWVKFRIAQTPDNQSGTVIENEASIYFDQNPPIVTPLVFYQIPFPETTVNGQVTLCEGEAWQGQVFESDTILSETVHYAFFDSIFTTAIAILPAADSAIVQTLCFGGSLTVNGTVYDQSNPTGTQVLTAFNGCDSTVTISLSFNNMVTSQLAPTLCLGESLMVNGTVYDASNPMGSEIFPNGSYLGCDSTVQVMLSFYPPAVANLTGPICQNESIQVFDLVFDINNPAGAVVIPGVSAGGCDSTVNVNLTFLENSFSELDTTLLQGEFWGETPISSDTSLTMVLPSANGCDSLVTVNISVLTNGVSQSGSSNFNLKVQPNPASSVIWASFELTSETELSWVLTNSLGQLANTALGKTKWQAGKHQLPIQLAGLPSGIYHLWVGSPAGRSVVKFVKID